MFNFMHLLNIKPKYYIDWCGTDELEFLKLFYIYDLFCALKTNQFLCINHGKLLDLFLHKLKCCLIKYRDKQSVKKWYTSETRLFEDTNYFKLNIIKQLFNKTMDYLTAIFSCFYCCHVKCTVFCLYTNGKPHKYTNWLINHYRFLNSKYKKKKYCDKNKVNYFI